MLLERARKRIQTRQEPFWTYWQATRPERESALATKPQPYVGSDSLKFHAAAQDQGIAARLLVYEWRLEGSEQSGTHAVELLLRWAEATPMPGTHFDPEIRFPNSGMDVARGMLPFVAAYDLLDGHAALTDENRRTIETWFRSLANVVKEGIRRWEDNDNFGGQGFQNHHAAHALGLVLFGAALRDDELIEFAIDSPNNPRDFQELIAGLILMPGEKPHGGLRNKPLHAGEIQDRHRTTGGAGLTYCHLSLTIMLYTAEILTRVTGDDWVNYPAPGGECLQLSTTLYTGFFRFRNERINGDYYFRDQRAIQNNASYLGTFEVALHHWPDVPNLRAIVRSINRARTPRSWLCYYGLPLLTHGVTKP